MSAKANREYKDSVFTSLFGEKDTLLELYNAIQNTNYGKDTDIKITTLENVLYKGQANDISFVIDGKIVVLIEHQSTINENMPLRMLSYIESVYKKIVKKKDMYKKLKIKIPYPEFIVLYNGKDKYPSKKTLKLSDMFKKNEDGKCPINLELLVQVYNINQGYNPVFAQKSDALDGYEMLVARVRYYLLKKKKTLKEAIDLAIKDCINEGKIAEFLESHSTEVKDMLLREWKLEDELDGQLSDGIEIGMQRGMRQGMRQRDEAIAINMLKKGMSVDEISELTGLFIDDILRLEY
ncbi:MAG: Rpn family recombination-promoting nuclease/putative transposase [Chitinivibrionia bacterium]|nr:Rpn family recombination-promoting nuclease/putative transposase [Chitinivibrionia bacterium]